MPVSPQSYKRPADQPQAEGTGLWGHAQAGEFLQNFRHFPSPGEGALWEEKVR